MCLLAEFYGGGERVASTKEGRQAGAGLAKTTLPDHSATHGNLYHCVSMPFNVAAAAVNNLSQLRQTPKVNVVNCFQPAAQRRFRALNNIPLLLGMSLFERKIGLHTAFLKPRFNDSKMF